MITKVLSTTPSWLCRSFLRNLTYRIPFMESSELRKIAVRRGAAIVQMAVTNPVVIKTTSTHPGTSPRSSSIIFCESCDGAIFFTHRCIPKMKEMNSLLTFARNSALCRFRPAVPNFLQNLLKLFTVHTPCDGRICDKALGALCHGFLAGTIVRI